MGQSVRGVYRSLGLALLLGGLIGLPSAAQNPPKKEALFPALKLPSGAIIVVAKDADSIDKAEAVYLSPEKYKELNDQIEALKKQLAAEKGMPANNCELAAKLEMRGTQSVVKVQAHFKFKTLTPRSIVFLGCQKAQPVEAKLQDGKLPLLSAGEKGLSILVEAVGEYSLRLDLELPVAPRGATGNEIGFEMGLPGATITTLTLETPNTVKRLTIARREIGVVPEPALDVKRYDAELLRPGDNREPLALGPLSYLAVSWEDAAQRAVLATARSAEADVTVTVSETDIHAEARLRLKGTAKEWRFLAPFNAEVNVGRASPVGAVAKTTEFPADQAPEIVRPEPGKSDWRIRFREDNSAELLVSIGTRSPRNRSADPKTKTVWPAGPFAALDVPKQEGVIRVRSSPQLRTTAILRGDTQRVDLGDDPNAEAVYRYRTLPTTAKDQVLAPLDLDIRAAVGVVQTRVHHRLQLGEGGWRLRADIAVTPIRSEVESLDLEVPVPGVFEGSTPKLIESIVPLRDSGPQRRIVQIKLSAPQRNEFTLTLEGTYPVALGVQEANLVLPRLLNVFDRASQVTVTIPEGNDLRGAAYAWETDKPATRGQALEPVTGSPTALSAGVSRSISHVELAWKPLRADMRVEAVADITLDDRHARVKQQMRYVFADGTSKRLRLRGPTTALGVAVSAGNLETAGPGDWYVTLPAEPVKEATFAVTYSFALPAVGDDGARFSVPLLSPDGATSFECRARFLRDPEASRPLLPSLEPDSAWQEMPLELLPQQATLLVARVHGVNVPLMVQLREKDAASASAPLVWIDRGLIQAQSDDVNQKYRVQLHLQKWQMPALELELPAGSTGIELRFNGLRIDVRESPSESGAGPIIRVPLPIWRVRDTALVELKYNVSGVNVDSWLIRWQPPQPRGRVAVETVRWQIALRGDMVPLSIGDAAFEESWTIRNGYPRPVPAYTSAELDKWIGNGQEPAGVEGNSPWNSLSTGVVARQTNLAPLRIMVAPRALWTITISAIIVACGLLLSRLARRTVGVALVLLAAAIVVSNILRPQPTGQALAAAQPGLLLLLLILGGQRFLIWRHRRRLARMPGFSRIHAESALSRSNGKRSVRESSAIDAPAGG